ncbi:hypothetical protein [Paenibacillus sp. 2TAB19]|uniref:hypothetical protein n=1 Tax=Paenibacillus sp. 2TAB19 TaxID=3233003 RepID=UPI003F9D48D8
MTNSYSKPITILKLEELNEKLLIETNNDLDYFLGVYIDFNMEGYDNITPLDSIVFASTGADGDHFAFDTINGSIEDLEEAPNSADGFTR